ncbi:MAG TPA: response regulator [Bacteroidales bacterium]|nr:response regulator [Bacteroidales bacterium]
MNEHIQKALIIDDETEICFLLAQILKRRNITSEYAGTITDALIIAEAFQPNIIFVDHRLPDGLGHDVIPILREKCPTARIIAMTAQEIFDQKTQVERCGADFLLEKPFLVNKVYELIEGLPVS